MKKTLKNTIRTHAERTPRRVKSDAIRHFSAYCRMREAFRTVLTAIVSLPFVFGATCGVCLMAGVVVGAFCWTN